jgi:hypothetical protein
MHEPSYEPLSSEGTCPPGLNCPTVRRDRSTGTVAIVGTVITDPARLAELGVGPGEAAVEITETMYRSGFDGLERRPA